MSNMSWFDPRSQEPIQALEAIPTAWYDAMVTESKDVQTKDGKGVYLSIACTIINGEYKGRIIFEKFNVKNDSQQAMDFAFQCLTGLYNACGFFEPIKNSLQLHSIPIRIKVKRVPAQMKLVNGVAEEEFPAKNVIQAYVAMEQASEEPGEIVPPKVAGKATPNLPNQPWNGNAVMEEMQSPVFTNQDMNQDAIEQQQDFEEPVTVTYHFEMTETAKGFTRAEFHHEGWTDDQLIGDGYMVAIYDEPPIVIPPPKAAPAPAPAPAKAAKKPPLKAVPAPAPGFAPGGDAAPWDGKSKRG